MYEDQYDKMKIAYSARKLLFLHTLKIYPTPDHVTRVRERILSDSVVLLSICSYLLVLILSKNFSPIMSSAIKKLNLLNRSSFEIVFCCQNCICKITQCSETSQKMHNL